MADRPREMDEFLSDRGKMIRACTTNPNGTPHIVPLCFKFNPDGGTFLLSTGADSVTAKNLRLNPAIALCIDDDEFPFRAVVVEGEGEVFDVLGVDHEGLKQVVDQFFGPEMWATYEKSPTAQKIRVRVNVKPKKWKFWDMGSKKIGSVRVG